MSVVVIDDHLLGDVIGGSVPDELGRLLRRHDLATTNLYYYRLCRAALAARGGALTAQWSSKRRHEAARALTMLSPEIEILPMKHIAIRMAELSGEFRLSALGAEAVAATEAQEGRLCVWEGDAGPGIRACCASLRVVYRTISR